MGKNIRLFKKFYFLLIVCCSIIQIIINETIEDYIILGMVISINLLILIYCIDENKFYKYPISLTVIFFSVFINSASALFFKTFELEPISSNLFSPLNTFTLFFFANLVVIGTHKIYEKRNNIITDNFFTNINHKLDLFNINTKFIFLLGTISIFSQLLLKNFLKTDLIDLYEHGPNLIYRILSGYDSFYLFPFILILSNKLFKKEFKINKLTIFLFLLIIVYISVGSNRRDVLFFGLLAYFMILFIVFLLDLIKFNRNNIIFLILLILIMATSFQKIITFNKIYLYERAFSDKRSMQENVKSFFKSLNNTFSGKLNLTTYENHYQYTIGQTKVKDYYNSLIYERINPIRYADSILSIYNELNERDIQKIKQYSINRLFSIMPQPILNIFNKDFKKLNYIYLTTASFISKLDNPIHFSRNDVGSFLVELKMLFGIFFFLPLIFVSYISFKIFDSFYNNKKKIFSPVIVVLFMSSGSSILDFFASPSLDIMANTLLREIPQTILIFVISYFLYNSLFNPTKIKK
jgi:hypothetical protein